MIRAPASALNQRIVDIGKHDLDLVYASVDETNWVLSVRIR
jgi:hypothetical protein